MKIHSDSVPADDSDPQNTPTEKVEAQLLERLGTLIANERQDDIDWEIGDIANELRARFKWKWKPLADRFKYSRENLIQLAHAAAAFPKQDRNIDQTMIYRYVRQASEKVLREVALHEGIDWANLPKRERPRADYLGDLKWIAEQRKNGETIAEQRQVTAALAQRARARMDAAGLRRSVLSEAANAAFVGKCFNQPCAEVIRKLQVGSVKLFHFDPPFSNYRKDDDGHLDISTSVGKTTCDNFDFHNAVRVTVDAIIAAEPKLERNGVILLWQSSTMPSAAVAKVIEDLRLGGLPFIIWDKRKPKLGDGVECIQFSTEVCYVLCRRGEKPLIHNSDLSKLQVISHIPPLTYSTAKIEEYHQMEKPLELNDLLIEQFTREGDVIVDGFGCRAGMCVSAHQKKRKWVYIESHPENFARGTARLRELLAGEERQVG